MMWLWALTAFADPVVLRAPLNAPGATAGLHDLSVGLPYGKFQFAVDGSTQGASAAVNIGSRRVLSGAGKVRQLQAGLSTGLLVPLVEPGLARTAAAWMHGGWVGDRGHFVAGAAIPWAVGLGGFRAPVLAELHGGGRLGPVALGARLSAGPVFTWRTDVSVWLEPALVVQIVPRSGP